MKRRADHHAERAREILTKFGVGVDEAANGVFLPLACPDAELWVYNPPVILDALDDQAIQGSRFDDGRFFMIDKHVFHAEVVAGVDMFKLANQRTTFTFCGQPREDAWAKSESYRGCKKCPSRSVGMISLEWFVSANQTTVACG